MVTFYVPISHIDTWVFEKMILLRGRGCGDVCAPCVGLEGLNIVRYEERVR